MRALVCVVRVSDMPLTGPVAQEGPLTPQQYPEQPLLRLLYKVLPPFTEGVVSQEQHCPSILASLSILG